MVVTPASIRTAPGGASDVVVEACRFLGGTPTFGVLVAGGSKDVFVSDSFFEGMLTGVLIDATGGPPIDDVVVESCRFDGTEDLTTAHIAMTGEASVSAVRIATCEFRPMLALAFENAAIASSGGLRSDVAVEGCVFRGINGIVMLSTTRMTVTGCTFDPAGVSPLYGIFLNGCNTVSVAGNVLNAKISYVDGFVFQDCSFLSVTGNHVNTGSGDGIRVVGESAGLIEIMGNTAAGCGGTGIKVVEGNRVTIEGNVTTNNGGDGIAVGTPETPITDVVVGGNISQGNGGDGLNLSANNLAVNCNVCCGNIGTGINFAGGDGASQTNVGNVRTTFLAEPAASATNALCFVPP